MGRKESELDEDEKIILSAIHGEKPRVDMAEELSFQELSRDEKGRRVRNLQETFVDKGYLEKYFDDSGFKRYQLTDKGEEQLEGYEPEAEDLEDLDILEQEDVKKEEKRQNEVETDSSFEEMGYSEILEDLGLDKAYRVLETYEDTSSTDKKDLVSNLRVKYGIMPDEAEELLRGLEEANIIVTHQFEEAVRLGRGRKYDQAKPVLESEYA